MNEYTMWSSGNKELDIKYLDDFNNGKLEYISFLSLAFDNIDILSSDSIICEKEFILDYDDEIVLFFCIDCVFIAKKYNSINLSMEKYLNAYVPFTHTTMDDSDHPFYLNNHFNILELCTYDDEITLNKSYLFNQFNFEQQVDIIRLWNFFFLGFDIDVNINPLNFKISRG